MDVVQYTGLAHRLGEPGKALIKHWEGCAKHRSDGCFDAYPDPGTKDGTPWTIGWGSTGPDVRKGVIWTQAQCDARFDIDIQRYVAAVAKALGSTATNQNQFDALVSFHYNTGAIASAELSRLHKQGRYSAAAKEFGKWVNNNGKPMQGLIRRRADEARLYSSR
ncbi:MAG: lysozyme [Novosphingobium sp.]